MRASIAASILVVLLAGASALAQDDAPAQESSGTSGNTQFLIGERYMTDKDFWEPFDTQMMFGVEVDFAPAKSPIHVALAGSFSTDDTRVSAPFHGATGDVRVGLAEFSAGFLWHPVRHGIVRPYIGGGAVLLGASIDTDIGSFFGDSDTDTSFGFYGNAGVFFKVGESFNIGVDGRIVRGTDFDFSGLQADADYEQVAMLLGFSWGKK